MTSLLERQQLKSFMGFMSIIDGLAIFLVFQVYDKVSKKLKFHNKEKCRDN